MSQMGKPDMDMGWVDPWVGLDRVRNLHVYGGLGEKISHGLRYGNVLL